jgi:hypothetical protein
VKAFERNIIRKWKKINKKKPNENENEKRTTLPKNKSEMHRKARNGQAVVVVMKRGVP